MTLSKTIKMTLVGLTTAGLLNTGSGITEGAQEKGQDVKNSVKVEAVQEKIKATIESTLERNKLMAELNGLDIIKDGILDLTEQKDIDTKGQLAELMAETLGISHDEFINQIAKNKEQINETLTLSQVFENIKREVKNYSEKHNGKVPLWDDQIEFSELDWNEIKTVLFTDGNVEDYAKMIGEISPESSMQIVNGNFKGQGFDNVIKYFALIEEGKKYEEEGKKYEEEGKKYEEEGKIRQKNINTANSILND